MAELPVMPLKTDALIADTTHMSAEEMGVYVRLLVAMWRHGAQLPDDPRELARIGGVSLRRWNKISERVLRPMTMSGGILTQKRLTSTWLEVQQLRETRATAASKRWNGIYANKHVKQ
jgi:uncharacterized protein YdaU (DUF1376 family)